MMSAKLATANLLKIKEIFKFWNKAYEVVIFVHDVTNKTLSCNSYYIVNLVMLPNFSNSSISMREVIIASIT